MHKGTNHLGKIPTSYQVSKKYDDQITDLRDRLMNAIKKENFEEAAKLRDEIKFAEDEYNESNQD